MSEARRKTGAFLPLRDSLAMRPRYLAARVTFHHGLLGIVLFLVFPPLVLALFGLLVYPAIFEIVRNWFR